MPGVLARSFQLQNDQSNLKQGDTKLSEMFLKDR